MAPNEPWTSVFRMTRSSLTSAAWIWALMSSRLAAPELAARRSTASAASRAAFSSATTRSRSPVGQVLETEDLDRGRRLG